jgi:hypothetical protein
MQAPIRCYDQEWFCSVLVYRTRQKFQHRLVEQQFPPRGQEVQAPQASPQDLENKIFVWSQAE